MNRSCQMWLLRIAWGTFILEISELVPRDCDSVGLSRTWETCFYINDSGAQAGMRSPMKAHGSSRWDEQDMNASSVLLCNHRLIASLRLGYLISKIKTILPDRNVLRTWWVNRLKMASTVPAHSRHWVNDHVLFSNRESSALESPSGRFFSSLCLACYISVSVYVNFALVRLLLDP